MKFKEFLEHANNLAKTNPESLDMDCFTSKDDEGNGFNKVVFDPMVSGLCFDNQILISLEELDEWGCRKVVILN